jgi:hypothetical protein
MFISRGRNNNTYLDDEISNKFEKNFKIEKKMYTYVLEL